jgi:CysZ protein
MTQLSPPCPSCGYPAENESCGQCDGKILASDGKATIEPGNRFFLIEIIEGFGSLFQAALSLMTDKAYMGKLKLAIVLNLVLVTSFAFGTGYGFFTLIDQILTSYEWLQGWGSATIALLLALIATWFLAPSLIEVGMSPFLDPIANATERIHGGEKMQPVHLGFWRNLTAALNAASQVLMIQIFVLIPVLILGVIPLVNLVAIPVGILISAYLNAVIWLEIPVVRRGYGMRYRYQIVQRNWARALGFGLAFNLGLLVPFFNILFLAPATAVAVSSLYFRFEKRTAA